MTKAEELYDEIAAELGATKDQMFGTPCLKAPNGKALAMLYDNEMVFKLRGGEESEATGLQGAHLFDPMGNRPMGGWVQIPFRHAGKWKEFAKKAYENVS
ncbi:MAG: hypothetical protein WD077_05565 [Bacteroidia bacterium]